MRITPVLKGHTDQYGRQAIFIRIADGKRRTFKNTKIKITPQEWDGALVISSPFAKKYNQQIRTAIFTLEQSYAEGVAKYPDADFFSYCTDCFNQWDHTKQESTLRQVRGELSKIKKFNAEAMMLSEITPKWLGRYREYCIKSQKNQVNTVWKSFKFLRLIINKALREKLIEDNPFHLFEPPRYREPHKIFLSREQIEQIHSFSKKEDIPTELRTAATWFVFACYTGLRFSDLAAFSKEKSIKQDRIIIATVKTLEIVSIPLNDTLHELLSAVDYKPLPFTNQYYNRVLKAVGALAGIQEGLTSHVSRHTFATLAMSSGISMDVVSKLMGHRSVRTTAIYAKLINPIVDAQYEKIFK